MGSKRKRSADDSPLSICSFGAVSTLEAQSPAPFPSNGWDFTSASRVKNSDWGNRTRKRFRDNRPDEHTIHENTLNKLFAAQRNHPEPLPAPSNNTPLQFPQQTTLTASKPQKSTLHSFWKQLPAPPVQPSMLSAPMQLNQTASHLPRCEDCEAPLLNENDSMDLDMDMDMGGAVENSPFACNGCGKHVCATCAVVSARRHCLQCAASGQSSARWW